MTFITTMTTFRFGTLTYAIQITSNLEGTKSLTSQQTGIIVKWSLFLGLVVLFAVYLIAGHWHAKKRIARGLPPLAYHRVRPTLIPSPYHRILLT